VSARHRQPATGKARPARREPTPARRDREPSRWQPRTRSDRWCTRPLQRVLSPRVRRGQRRVPFGRSDVVAHSPSLLGPRRSGRRSAGRHLNPCRCTAAWLRRWVTGGPFVDPVRRCGGASAPAEACHRLRLLGVPAGGRACPPVHGGAAAAARPPAGRRTPRTSLSASWFGSPRWLRWSTSAMGASGGLSPKAAQAALCPATRPAAEAGRRFGSPDSFGCLVLTRQAVNDRARPLHATGPAAGSGKRSPAVDDGAGTVRPA
jgi:hypothetical protein